MRLKSLLKHRWDLRAPLDAQDRTEVEIFLGGLDGNYKTSVHGVLALMERFAKGGPECMNYKLYHWADKDQGIREFIKGDLRILCFEADGAVVVCACGYVKKSQKSDLAMVARAARVKREYEEAARKNALRFI